MKQNLTRSLIAAAALSLGAAVVFAQTKLTANVPFAFTTMGAYLPSGQYSIVSASPTGYAVLRIRNVATGHEDTIGLGVPAIPDGNKEPRLVFKCADDKCALSEVWRDDGRGYKIWTPRTKASQLEHVAVIYLDRKNAD